MYFKVAKIRNEAKEIVEKAKAEAEFISTQAETNFSRTIETVHNKGNPEFIIYHVCF